MKRTSNKGDSRPSTGKPPPPAWEPELFVDPGESAAELKKKEALEWSKEDEQLLRGRIREAMEKIENISCGLGTARKQGEGYEGDSGGGLRRGGGGDGGVRVATAARRDRKGRKSAGAAHEDDGSIEGLHGALKLSLELVTTGEKHASANTTTMTDLSEWLLNLEQKQLVSSECFAYLISPHSETLDPSPNLSFS